MLDRKHHPFYYHSDAAFFLARKSGGRVIGRLAALDNRKYNDYNRERTAFFYLFECVDDERASRALFSAAEEWARSRGLSRFFGPKGFSALDGMGLLVEGFQHRPAFGIPYNLEYYPHLVESSGFRPAGDVVSGHLTTDAHLPEKILAVADLVERKRGLRVLNFRTRGEMRRYIPRLKDLYNDEEVRAMADQILWFADPRLIKLILKNDEVIGFLFAYPDISAALQRTGGRIWPFGWIAFLREYRTTKWVNINGAGIDARYRGLGGTALLFREMGRSLDAGRFEHADLVQIGVENFKMQAELRNLGVDFYKRHRMYSKDL
jgi:GNAT superfamily N-acetyltransferase